jgi:ribonuclease P protein component
MAGGGGQQLRWSRAQRLEHTRDFTRLRNSGQRLALGSLIANWMMDPGGKSSRVGVIVSRKVGGAVVRNRSRRLIREACRLHWPKLAGPVNLVLVARPSIADKTFAAVEADFIRLLQKAGLYRAAS